MQEWIGIAGVTLYSPTIFRIAGIANKDSQWIAGLNTITYMLSTLICVFTLDRIGRCWTLYWGSIMQAITLFLAGGLSKVAKDTTGSMSKQSGNAAVAMVFLFTITFGATWLTVPWLYPAEIFPLNIRTKGNAWGVVGWSIGNGWLTLLCPVMFNAISEYTLFIFAACNILTLPMVYCLYPETNQRTLEEMNLLFAADSPWVWDAEKNYRTLVEENPDLVQAARRGSMAAGDLERQLREGSTAGASGRKFSLATGNERRTSQAGTEVEYHEKSGKDL